MTWCCVLELSSALRKGRVWNCAYDGESFSWGNFDNSEFVFLEVVDWVWLAWKQTAFEFGFLLTLRNFLIWRHSCLAVLPAITPCIYSSFISYCCIMTIPCSSLNEDKSFSRLLIFEFLWTFKRIFGLRIVNTFVFSDILISVTPAEHFPTSR